MQKEQFRDDLGSKEWPTEEHAPIHGSSIQLGQFALLVKKDNNSNNDNSNNNNNFTCTEENPIVATTTTITSSSQQDSRSSNDTQRDGNQGNEIEYTRKRPNPSVHHHHDAASTTKVKGKPKIWPALLSDDWCPPGTSIVTLNKGSIHSCSDKLCRWNYLGIQGSLLSSMLEFPLFLSSLTVGRKFTECICRRAVCCRLVEEETKKRNNKRTDKTKNPYEKHSKEDSHPPTTLALAAPTIPTKLSDRYRLNHPAILGTSVLLHEGAVETQSDTVGQDVRFHSSLCWAWWPSSSSSLSSSSASCSLPIDNNVDPPTHDNDSMIECINGTTGFSVTPNDYKSPFGNLPTISHHETISPVSTYALGKLFLETLALAKHLPETSTKAGEEEDEIRTKLGALQGLRQWKRLVSPEYEGTKKRLFGTHRVLRQWRRRMPES